jgi:SpoVK/Ycf46/Vps4 family AAA+-type ATPase
LGDRRGSSADKAYEVRSPLSKSYKGLMIASRIRITLLDANNVLNRLADHAGSILAESEASDEGVRIFRASLDVPRLEDIDLEAASAYALARFLSTVAPLAIREVDEEGFGVALAFVDASEEEPRIIALGIGSNKCQHDCSRIIVRSVIAVITQKSFENKDEKRRILIESVNKVHKMLNTSTVINFLDGLGYQSYEIVRMPIAIYIVTSERGESEGAEVVIREGMETFVVKLPTRSPEWSLSMFPKNLVSDLETMIIKPIKMGYSFAPKGVILMGPPGVGKSVLAEAIAQSLGKKVVDLKPSVYRSMWYGMTEKILDRILKSIMKRTDITLVIDDAEFLLSRTMAVHEVHISEISQILNFLQRSTRPLTILTSNTPTLIDPAILRPGRIDVAVVIGYPDREARKTIVENLLKKYNAPRDEKIVEEIVRATRWMSNAEIDALIRMALSKGEGKITQETIDWARKRFRIDHNVRASEHQFLRWSISHMPGLVISYIPQDHEI